MYRILLLFFLSFCTGTLSAQVDKNVIVEHFTNTRCGICGFQNPALFDNLNNNPDILHLSTHPSSPYSNCILNQHNVAENDARTNFYNIYGSTPRIVIQGQVYTQSASNWGNSNLFDGYLNQMTPASIAIQQSKTDELIEAQITLTTEGTHDLGDLHLYIVLAEDTIFYDAPNGEDQHYNVFRKNVSEGNGFVVNLPENVGEEVSFNISSEVNAEWDVDRIYTLAILQDASTNEVIQVWAAPADLNEPISSVRELPELKNVTIAPNPTSDFINITLDDSLITRSYLYNLNGQLVSSSTFQQNTKVSLAELSKGAYWIKVINDNGVSVQKVIRN